MTQRHPLAIAHSVVEEPARVHTVATRDMLAICQALIDSDARPQISDELADAIRGVLTAFVAADQQCSGFGTREAENALTRSITILTNRFEEEFPQ